MNIGTLIGLGVLLIMAMAWQWIVLYLSEQHRRRHRDLDQFHPDHSGNVTDMYGEEKKNGDP